MLLPHLCAGELCLYSITNNPDQFASELHTELLNTARFRSIDSSELEALYAASEDVAGGSHSPPPPPSPNGAKVADISAESEQAQPTAAASPQAAEETTEQHTAADDKTETGPSTASESQQGSAIKTEAPKQRRIRVIPPHNFSCLVAYEIRSQIQAHLHGILRATTKKGAPSKHKHPSLPILAGGPVDRTTLQQQGQQRQNQLNLKPPLVTVRANLIAAAIAHSPHCFCATAPPSAH